MRNVTGKVWAYLPVSLVCLHLLVGLACFVVGSAMLNDGHLVYTLDDAYIHMAFAKNLVTHGVFGVTRYAFTSATSSPLWTLLVALTDAIFGIHEATPFMLAALAAVLCVFAADRLAARFGIGPWPRAGMGLAIVYLTPLCTLASTGLEHCLHTLWILLLLGLTIDLITAPPRAPRAVLLCGVACLAVATRYESLFLVFPLTLVLALYRRFRTAACTLAVAALPVLLYGAVSIAHGNEFLPNSLLLKGNLAGIHSVASFFDFIGMHGVKCLLKEPHLLALTLALLLRAVVGRSPLGAALRWLQTATAMAIVAHLQWAQAGWFYRYEAYLVAAALFLLSVDLLSRRRADTLHRHGWAAAAQWVCAVGMGVLVLWPLQVRARQAWWDMVPGSHDIFEQQYQMGRFFAGLPDHEAVAVNDLGAVSFFGDRPIVDLWGLGSIEVARAKREGAYDTAAIAAVLARHDVKYICVYPNWFLGDLALPPHLIRVGTWRTPLDTSGGGHTVMFLAPDDASAWRLAYALHDFAPRLPWTVYCRIFLPDNRTAGQVGASLSAQAPAATPDDPDDRDAAAANGGLTEP